MDKNLEDKRRFPRVKANVRLKTTKNVLSESIDLSEGGISFDSNEVISSPTISLNINFPEEKSELKVDARLIWERSLEDGKSIYGVEFIDLDETQKSILRKELIMTQIKSLLNEIKEPQVKKDISNFFLKDMLVYISEITRIASFVSKHYEYSEEMERKIIHLSNEILLKGYCLEELIENKIIMNKNKESFRFLVGAWVYKSPMIKRAFDKPKGYPGDYLMLESVYDNQPLAKSGIGVYFDKYFLSSPYAVAVRCRKDKLREFVEREIKQEASKNIKIFDIACGSCREIIEIPVTSFKGKAITFSCLDWDEDALEFSRNKVSNFPSNVKFNFIKEDIMKLIKDFSLINSFENQDLVYSIGLIDYLPDRILKLFLQFFYGILKVKGKLILTHKNKEKTFSPVGPDWFCNWKFVPRSKEEVVHLFYSSGIKDFSLSTEVDEFNDIFYFTFIKLK